MAVFQHMYGERARVGIACPGGRTKQSFRDECDINKLMRKYEQSGQLPASVRVGSYGDFATDVDLLAAQLLIKSAEAQFDSLPARVRERFRNSPEEFLKFVQDRKNQEEARKLGLLQEEPAPPAPPVPPAAG